MKIQDVVINQHFVIDGVDMDCKPTEVICRLLEFVSDNEHFDCIITSENIKCYANLSDLRPLRFTVK